MTTNAERIFVDTNVLTRATIAAAPLHTEARTLLDSYWETDTELYISHQVIREYVANATRPQSYSPALPMDKVLKQVEDFRESFYVLHETPATLENLLMLARTIPMGGKQLHDANIVATMLAHNITQLFTHNVGDFVRFSAYITVILLTISE